MDVSQLYRSNERINNGGWVKDIPGLGDLELKVRGIESKAYRDLEQKIMMGMPRSAQLRGLDESQRERLTFALCTDALLLDWRNLAGDGPDDVIPYSPEAAVVLLSNPDLPALRGAVLWAAQHVGDIREEDRVAIKASLAKLREPSKSEAAPAA